MYIPKSFNESNTEVMHDLIRAHPLSTLVTNSSTGLTANHIPFYLMANETYGLLQGHVARANPLWRDLSNTDVLVVFQGVNTYISPSWYVTKTQTGRVVPTWNYAAVHAYGTLRVIEDAAWLRAQLNALTTQQEARFEQPWVVDDAPLNYTDQLIEHAIVGIEITITRLEGKWKVSQNQPSENQCSVVEALNASNDLRHIEMAQLIQEQRKQNTNID
jgi:transcriptional regulator